MLKNAKDTCATVRRVAIAHVAGAANAGAGRAHRRRTHGPTTRARGLPRDVVGRGPLTTVQGDAATRSSGHVVTRRAPGRRSDLTTSPRLAPARLSTRRSAGAASGLDRPGAKATAAGHQRDTATADHDHDAASSNGCSTTHVNDRPPLRATAHKNRKTGIVATDQRGFIWVKWVRPGSSYTTAPIQGLTLSVRLNLKGASAPLGRGCAPG